jgi:DNA-binding LytR/AlgR family response regulator
VLAIGLFPITVFTFVRQGLLQKKFTKESDTINEIIAGTHPIQEQSSELQVLSIPSQNISEHFSVIVSDIIFIRSADNYVEIFYRDKNKINRKLIRNSMQKIEKSLRSYPQFFRCHKSFLVNLEKVSRVSGNAQGLKLVLNEVEELIPVSRNLTKIIRKRVAVHH